MSALVACQLDTAAVAGESTRVHLEGHMIAMPSPRSALCCEWQQQPRLVLGMSDGAYCIARWHLPTESMCTAIVASHTAAGCMRMGTHPLVQSTQLRSQHSISSRQLSASPCCPTLSQSCGSHSPCSSSRPWPAGRRRADHAHHWPSPGCMHAGRFCAQAATERSFVTCFCCCCCCCSRQAMAGGCSGGMRTHTR
jgi:hypothetical protein